MRQKLKQIMFCIPTKQNKKKNKEITTKNLWRYSVPVGSLLLSTLVFVCVSCCFMFNCMHTTTTRKGSYLGAGDFLNIIILFKKYETTDKQKKKKKRQNQEATVCIHIHTNTLALSKAI